MINNFPPDDPQPHIDTPEPLQGFGLSQKDLALVMIYWTKMVEVGNRQRMSLSLFAMVAIGMVAVQSMRTTSDLTFLETLPETLLMIGIPIFIFGLAVNQAMVYGYERSIRMWGYQPRALKKILSQGRTILLYTIFHLPSMGRRR